MDRSDKFIIGELLGDVFGITSPIYIPWGAAKQYTAGQYQGVQLLKEDESDVLSWMGTPVMGTFSLLGGTYKTFDEKGQISEIKLSDFLMPYATIVEFNRAMNVTKTKAIGTAGTVKEIYGLDDWAISIRGICLADAQRPDQQTAQQQIDALVKWRNVTDTVNVQGSIFNDKEIYGITIDNLSIRPVQGKWNVITYEIQATSDNPIELML